MIIKRRALGTLRVTRLGMLTAGCIACVCASTACSSAETSRAAADRTPPSTPAEAVVTTGGAPGPLPQSLTPAQLAASAAIFRSSALVQRFEGPRPDQRLVIVDTVAWYAEDGTFLGSVITRSRATPFTIPAGTTNMRSDAGGAGSYSTEPQPAEVTGAVGLNAFIDLVRRHAVVAVEAVDGEETSHATDPPGYVPPSYDD